MLRKYVTVEDKELREYLIKIRNNKITRKNFLREVGIEGAKKYKENVNPIQAFGNLERLITYETEDYGVGLIGGADYTEEAAETGTPKGRKVSVSAIAAWQKKKGIPGSAFAIAKKIEKEGSKKFREKGPRLITKTKNDVSDRILPPLINKYVELTYD